ncbi:hypothetical protein [Polaromonas sp.]|uniref:hypothetical protein n=1 Tax=Polaromonas sp. TaxID=1869339 RepID=UPI003BB5D436
MAFIYYVTQVQWALRFSIAQQQGSVPVRRKIRAMNYPRLNPVAALGLASLLLHHAVSAAPLLRCDVTYAGTTHVIEATPVADPYPLPSVDIGGRFRFKAVMVGGSTQIDRILLYAYLDARMQPILIQEAKYLPPFKASATPYPLTGEQHLYAGPVERELIYSCTLEGVQP